MSSLAQAAAVVSVLCAAGGATIAVLVNNGRQARRLPQPRPPETWRELSGLERSLLVLVALWWLVIIVAVLTRWPGGLLWSLSSLPAWLAARLVLRWIGRRHAPEDI